MDTVGSFGRSVEDATIILNIIADKGPIIETQADAFESLVDQHSITT